MKNRKNSILKPAEFAERELLTGILDGTYPVGSTLPSERELAARIGVTRPTFREILQRLAREGWITIRHGKATMVNDYWNTGGLGMFATLTRYGKFLPKGFLFHLIEVRNSLLPDIAELAVLKASDNITEYLKNYPKLKENANAFVKFDWELQMLMVKHSENPIFSFIFNDFKSIYTMMTLKYFKIQKARELAKNYYKDLLDTIKMGHEAVGKLIKSRLKKSGEIWKDLT
ncbi:MAG: fatty acid metabolism transcriptional regulator FadR [Deltaproteobacteria bacterium]|nr:fatty acid metabolism transcriptional regulator FadR [Deltaproteobacteria bacterium]